MYRLWFTVSFFVLDSIEEAYDNNDEARYLDLMKFRREKFDILVEEQLVLVKAFGLSFQDTEKLKTVESSLMLNILDKSRGPG